MTPSTRRLLSALTTLPFAAAAPALGQPGGHIITTHHEQVLGTSLQITLRTDDPAIAHRAEAAILAIFDRQSAILSAWNSHSEFSRWTATRFKAIQVSPDLFATLAAFDLWRERTAGALDPSVEAATRLWSSAAAEGRTPTAEEIATTQEAIAQPHWSLDPTHQTATRLTGVPLALATFAKSRITALAADAALAAGAQGVLLNVGGDLVARGNITRLVSIADPRATAGNDPALDHLLLHNAALATSGSYHRGFLVTGTTERHSHLIDPRTATPVSQILSSSVLAPDAEIAGALATALSVMPLAAGQQLVARSPGAEYLLITSAGESIQSSGWPGAGTARQASILPAAFATPVAGFWNPAFELAIELNLPRLDDARYRRPYIAVWVEDADHFPVRTLSLWTQNPRWLPELKQWYRDDQIRNLSEGTDISRTISSATRPPGKYSLKWDGKDNEGKPVKAGDYTIVIEASREHGGYQIERQTIDFNTKPTQATLQPGKEVGLVTLDYRKR